MRPVLESRSWKPGQAWRPLYAEKRRNDLRRIREVSALYSNYTSASTGAIRANFMTLMLPKRAFRIDNLGRRVRSRSLSQNFPNPYGSRWGEPLTQSYCSLNACWRRARPDMSFIWKAALAANTRRTVADDDREDNGWILVGRKENSRDILTYERPEYIVQREQPTCDKKW